LAQKLGDFPTMAFQPFTLTWHVPGRPDNFKKITISETEINDGNYFTLTGVRCPLLRVETPFRDDEIFHGTLLSKGGETISPQYACDEYIEQLKYRREKNELIQDLRYNGRTLSKNWVRAIGGTWVLEVAAISLEDIRMDSVPSLITEDKRISGLERENKELREKIIAEKEMFSKRVFEVTEEMTLLKQASEDNTRQVILVAEEIPDVSDLKAQIQSLKLQLATEKRISQKYAKTIQDRASALTAM